MTKPCDLCGGPCNPYDESSYKQVAGWVHGKKSDSMTLREETGKVAHEKCILKAKAGIAPDDADLFEEQRQDADDRPIEIMPQELIEELFDHYAPPPTIAGLGEMLGLKEKDK